MLANKRGVIWGINFRFFVVRVRKCDDMNVGSCRWRCDFRELGKKRAGTRGVGLSSKEDFVLPSVWSTEVQSTGSRDTLEFVSPGKSRYNSREQAKDGTI